MLPANTMRLNNCTEGSETGSVLLQMYQEFNDFLLNILCSPDLEFQTDNLPPKDT